MVAPSHIHRRLRIAGVGLLFLLLAAASVMAQDFSLESVGTRGGFSGEDTSKDFYQAELFANWRLPLTLDLGKQWSLGTRLDLTAGWVTDRGEDAAIGSLGPSLVLRQESIPVALDVGLSPTLSSRHNFPEQNLGTTIQFTSHAGLEWKFAEHWSLGYRFQHMSNADLSKHNPGLNMHLFGLTYYF